MKRQLGTIEELGPRLFRLRVSAGRDPITGKRRRPVLTFEGTRRQAEAKLAQMIADTGAQTVTTTVTSLESYLRSYWLPHAKRLRPNTYEGYEREVVKHIIPLIGDTPLDKLSPWTLDQWLLSMKRTGVPDPTRKYAMKVLRIALRQAVRWRMLASDPTDAVEKITTRAYVPRVLTSAEAQWVLGWFAGHPLEVVVYLALGGGLRRSEILGLFWGDVNLETGVLTVERGFHATGGYQDTKTEESERTIHLPSWAVDSLKRHKAKQEATAKHFTVMATTPIVATRKGTPMGPMNVTHRYRAHLLKGENVYTPLKELRHSHATLALASGTDIVVVSRRLGHSQVGTTTKFYVRPAASEDAAASDRFEGFVAPPEDEEDEPEAQVG